MELTTQYRVETKRAENNSAQLGSAWHDSVLGEENIAVWNNVINDDILSKLILKL